MRKALNENPAVQMGVLALVGIAFAFLLFTMVLKKDSPPVDPAAATDPTATATDPTAAVPAGTATPPAVDPATGVALPPAVPPAGGVAPSGGDLGSADGLLPTKGLPKDVLVAYAKGRAVALLIIDPKAIADRELKKYTQRLEGEKKVELFVVEVRDIGDYARITAGVSVNRVPALVVIRPRKLTSSVPTATVSYGFRSPRSVQQALDDALYEGKQLQSYP